MIKFYAKTKYGKNKTKNDDCFLVNSLVSQNEELKMQTKNENFIVAVADGVGSSKYGDIASRYLLDNLSKNSNILSHQLILNIIKNTNSELLKQYKSNASTVFSIVYANSDIITIYHVGDTRVYKLTNQNNLVQLTNDHTYIQKLIDDGAITEPMTFNHPKKNIILQSLGNKQEIHIDIYKNSFEKGERLLLTSDGIHDYIKESEIKNIINTSRNNQKNLELLIDIAKENMSLDDLTAVIVEYN